MTSPNQRLKADPAEVIRRLPGIGRLMLIHRSTGVTHERIGTIETLEIAGDIATAHGAEHDSRIELPLIAQMQVDRSSVMGDKAFPRVNFLDAAGETLFSAISFAGMEPFDAALAGFDTEELPAKEAGAPFERGAEAAEDDPARAPFDRALASGTPVRVTASGPGFVQNWQGVVEGVKPSMGFINVMRADFHLHLKAGVIAGWASSQSPEGEVLTALDAANAPLALSVTFTA